LRRPGSKGLVQDPEEMILLEAMREAAVAGDAEKAWETLEEMRVTNVPRGRRVYEWAVEAYRKAGSWREVPKLIPLMEDDKIRIGLEVFNTVIEGCHRAGDVDEALDAMVQMRQAGHMANLVTYSKVLELLSRAKRWDEANQLFREAQRYGFMQPWVEGGNILELKDYNVELAAFILRHEIERKARGSLGLKAGRGTIRIFTGSGKNSGNNVLQRKVFEVLEQELGLKVTKKPIRTGFCEVKVGELRKLGEWLMEIDERKIEHKKAALMEEG